MKRAHFVAAVFEGHQDDGLEPGDEVKLAVEPTDAVATFTKAVQQSKDTTQPKKPRPDALVHGKR